MSQCGACLLTCSLTHLPVLAQVINLCEKEGLSINGSDYDMRSALHLASGEGRLAVVVYLLAAGANPNAEDRWGGRPLDDALRHSHADVEKALLSAGGEEGGSATAGSNTGVSRATSYVSSGTGKGRQVGGPGRVPPGEPLRLDGRSGAEMRDPTLALALALALGLALALAPTLTLSPTPTPILTLTLALTPTRRWAARSAEAPSES